MRDSLQQAKVKTDAQNVTTHFFFFLLLSSGRDVPACRWLSQLCFFYCVHFIAVFHSSAVFYYIEKWSHWMLLCRLATFSNRAYKHWKHSLDLIFLRSDSDNPCYVKTAATWAAGLCFKAPQKCSESSLAKVRNYKIKTGLWNYGINSTLFRITPPK